MVAPIASVSRGVSSYRGYGRARGRGYGNYRRSRGGARNRSQKVDCCRDWIVMDDVSIKVVREVASILTFVRFVVVITQDPSAIKEQMWIIINNMIDFCCRKALFRVPCVVT